MGGTTFETYAKGADPGLAFRDAQDQATFEHGHGGYTGTIAEKGSYTVITYQPMERLAAEQLAYDLIEKCDSRIDDKWGPAGAIPVVEGGESRREKVTITIPGGLDWKDEESTIRTEAQRKVKVKADEQFVGVVQVQRIESGKHKVAVTVPKEKATTRYVVSNTAHDRWETGFESQARARAAATEIANRPGNQFTRDVTVFDIHAITRRADGRPLVSVTRTVSRKTLEVEVQISKKVTKTTPDGWLFFGWASC